MKPKSSVGTAPGGLSKKKQPPPLATPVSTPKTRERRFLLSWRKSRKAEAERTPSLWSRSSSKGHDHSKTTPKTQEEERQQGDAGATTTRLRRASTLDGPEGEWGFRSASVDVEAICSTSSQVGRSNPSCGRHGGVLGAGWWQAGGQGPRWRARRESDGPDGCRSASLRVRGVQLTGEQALSALRPLRLLALDHRYQLAGRVLERVEAFLRQAPRDQQHAASQQEVRQAMEAEDLKALVERVRQRLRAVEEAIRELDKVRRRRSRQTTPPTGREGGPEQAASLEASQAGGADLSVCVAAAAAQADDWIECARLLGVTTSYKLNADRTITVKMTGESRGSLFNQVGQASLAPPLRSQHVSDGSEWGVVVVVWWVDHPSIRWRCCARATSTASGCPCAPTAACSTPPSAR